MDKFTMDDFEALAQKECRPCTSMFMSALRTDAEQNRIRFKNLLGRVEQMMDALPEGYAYPAEAMEHAKRLLTDLPFWQHQSDGLALFLGHEIFQPYCLPIPFENAVVVAGQFHLKPVAPLATNDDRFYVLSLSQRHVSLLEGNRYAFQEVKVEGMPKDIEDALSYDDPERQLQFHTGAAAGSNGRPAMFHGHGVGIDDTKDRILRYFQEVDKWVSIAMQDEKAPLILAALPHILPLYKEANSYPHLIEDAIPGNPDETDAEVLHQKAWQIQKQRIMKVQEDALAMYHALAGTGKTSKDLKEILLSAAYGRVGTLFVAKGAHQWGRFDRTAQTVELHRTQKPGDEDLLNTALVETVLKGGDVYLADRIPDNAYTAAIFRY
jgi:hypothetical protein